ncbi:MAG TPA: hypothetical protein DIW77_22785 [Chromatiaceae bacterium]|jgi:hypothetical protein|nr:MAG: hypothetical protein N838_07775 [Thiohalocapsa sp. PB-PSB1]HCS92782.1 hypothetical protein [Chromatiaceae bacterium]
MAWFQAPYPVVPDVLAISEKQQFRRLPERSLPTGAGFSFAFATMKADEKTSQMVGFSTEIALRRRPHHSSPWQK